MSEEINKTYPTPKGKTEGLKETLTDMDEFDMNKLNDPTTGGGKLKGSGSKP